MRYNMVTAAFNDFVGIWFQSVRTSVHARTIFGFSNLCKKKKTIINNEISNNEKVNGCVGNWEYWVEKMLIEQSNTVDTREIRAERELNINFQLIKYIQVYVLKCLCMCEQVSTFKWKRLGLMFHGYPVNMF